ncbi:MAG: bifunctional glycosyltransferase family 2 protein/CDP-glycerol:glycerophosphate glycerophosphotransferase [Lachnospiraceae bacterium]|nr:bifunctional glycosyltransferase family 2 protein/CDP-glycerol:glycerophosphate glycerophosphotransferase [Lachnospiraceae bacterium]
MKISVIIPFWKYKFYLEDCLKSLEVSNYKDFETVLVLDHIEEDIDDLIALYKEPLNMKVVTLPEDKHGCGAARNFGIQEATGEYVYFLDSDDYVLENTLGVIAETIDKKPNRDVYSGVKFSTWYKRLNYLERDHSVGESRRERKYEAWKESGFEGHFESFDLDANKKTAMINLILIAKNFFSVSVLKNAYKKDIIVKNGLKFNETRRNYIDQPFVVQLLALDPTVAECLDAFYIKRKHNDPYNYPAISQEENADIIDDRLDAYEEAIKAAKKDEALRQCVELLFSKFVVSKFVIKLRRSQKEKYQHYYDRMQPICADMNPESYASLSKYKRTCMELMAQDKKDELIKHVGKKLLKKRAKNIFKKRSMNDFYKMLYHRKYLKQPIMKNVIMFESFFGKSYSDSPKFIYEYIAKNYPGKYEFVWVLNNDTELPYGGKKVKRFSADYAKYLARAKFLVFNGRQPLWMKKREDQVFLETWHGTPLKRLVFDMEEVLSASPRYKINVYKQKSQWDYLVSANRFSTEVFKSCFMYDGVMLDYGYPRNDILYTENLDELAASIREKIGIPKDKKTILYAPTWRDDDAITSGQYSFKLALDLERLQKEFSDEYVVLLRTHYFIADKIDVTGLEGFVYNLSDYNDIAELYLISDICMTDYSSVFFDYANLKRPILFFTYDLDKYRDQLRGFYISIEDDVPGPLLLTNDDVVDAIKNIDQVVEDYKEKYEIFYDRFCTYDDGKASERIVQRVFIDDQK